MALEDTTQVLLLKNLRVKLRLPRFYFRLFEAKKTEEDLELIRFCIKRFGYRPKSLSCFTKAITHKSFDQDSISNERLEFLGDSIIDAVVAEFLFEKFPYEDEGYLTKIKSKLVSRKTLSEIAESMQLESVLRYHKGRSISISTIEGNAFEAIIGAIYLDGGYIAAQKSLLKTVFRNYVDLNKILEEEIDFKSRLFILSQKNKYDLSFNVISEINLGATWEYKVMVEMNKKGYGIGTGNSKKIAEQAAAKQTLELLGVI